MVGGGTPFFTSLGNSVNLNLVEARTFPGGVVPTRYETRRQSVPPGVGKWLHHPQPRASLTGGLTKSAMVSKTRP